jgi:hypothetical protein
LNQQWSTIKQIIKSIQSINAQSINQTMLWRMLQDGYAFCTSKFLFV